MEKANSHTDKNTTLYQEFEETMSGIFELVYDMDWMETNDAESKITYKKQFSLLSKKAESAG